jgi:hypothetical protein
MVEAAIADATPEVRARWAALLMGADLLTAAGGAA